MVCSAQLLSVCGNSLAGPWADIHGPLRSLGRTTHSSFGSCSRAGSAPHFPSHTGPCTCWVLSYYCVCPCLLGIFFFFSDSIGELLKHECYSTHSEGSPGHQGTDRRGGPAPITWEACSTASCIRALIQQLSNPGMPREHKMMTNIVYLFH